MGISQEDTDAILAKLIVTFVFLAFPVAFIAGLTLLGLSGKEGTPPEKKKQYRIAGGVLIVPMTLLCLGLVYAIYFS